MQFSCEKKLSSLYTIYEKVFFECLENFVHQLCAGYSFSWLWLFLLGYKRLLQRITKFAIAQYLSEYMALDATQVLRVVLSRYTKENTNGLNKKRLESVGPTRAFLHRKSSQQCFCQQPDNEL